ncbi:phage tail protein [Pontimicrobium sp. MEBiC06410]
MKTFKLTVIGLLVLCITQITFAQNDALKILSNGNVGVGTNAPKVKLEVNGDVKSRGRIKDKTGVIMPVGSIIQFAGTKAPEGWLLCDGSTHQKSGSKGELFKVVGYTYGGSGNNFKVPDLRSTFPMGANAAVAAEKVGKKGNPDQHSHKVNPPKQSFTTNTKGAHRHRFWPNWYKRGFAGGGYSGIDTNGRNIKNEKTESEGSHNHSVAVDIKEFNSGSSSDKNRPKWIALNYIIKY